MHKNADLESVGLGDKIFFMLKSNLRKVVRTQGNNPKYSAHGIEESIIYNIPNYIKNPILIIRTGERISIIADERVDTQRSKSVPLLIGINTNGTVDGKPAYEIKSIYGVDNFANWLSQRARDSKILAGKNKSKVDALLRDVGLHLSEPVAYADDLTPVILSHTGDFVNNEIKSITTSFESLLLKNGRKQFDSVVSRYGTQKASEMAGAFRNFYNGARNGLSYEQIMSVSSEISQNVPEAVLRSAFFAGQNDANLESERVRKKEARERREQKKGENIDNGNELSYNIRNAVLPRPNEGVEWARDILSHSEIKQFYSDIADLKKQKFKFPKAGDGSYIIETENKFILTDGLWTKPTIRCVFTVNNKEHSSKIKEYLYDWIKEPFESNAFGRSCEEAVRITNTVFGDESVSFRAIEDSEKTYGRQNGRGEGANSGKTYSGTSGDGKNSVNKNTPVYDASGDERLGYSREKPNAAVENFAVRMNKGFKASGLSITTQVYYDSSKDAVRGEWIFDGEKTVIRLNGALLRGATAASWAMSHELFHEGAKNDSSLVSLTLSAFERCGLYDGSSFETYKAAYEAAHGKELSREFIEEEIAADLMFRILGKRELCEMFAAKADKGLLSKLSKFFRGFAKKLHLNFDKSRADRYSSDMLLVAQLFERAVKNVDNTSQVGYNGEVRSAWARPYWTTRLTKTQFDILLRKIHRDIKTSRHPVTETANWMITDVGNIRVFAIYSTEVFSEPTIIYVSKAAQAENDKKYLENILMELEREVDVDRKAEIIHKLFESNGNSKTGDWDNNFESSDSSGDRGNDTILQATSPKYRPGPAFGNVLRNLFEIQYRRER